MESRYSVKRGNETLMFNSARDVVEDIYTNHIRGAVAFSDKFYPDVSATCNIHSGEVSTDDGLRGSVKNSYTDLTKPIERAMSEMAKSVLELRLTEIKDPVIQQDIQNQLLPQRPPINLSLFPVIEQKIRIGGEICNLKSLNDVDSILEAAKSLALNSIPKMSSGGG